MNITTKYGILKGGTYVSYYPDGCIREVTLTEPNEFDTPYGKFIPQYIDDGFRRKLVKPVIFHKNGSLKNLPLQTGTEIKTSVGILPAELITWYEDSTIHRIFPLDGMLTGFWTEDDEYELSQPLEFNLLSGQVREKVVAVQFYKNGALKGLTFWPGDTVKFSTPLGAVDVRIGASFYPNGTIKSFEPGKPLIVDTPIGKIRAFDRTAIGIHSDSTSVGLSETGKIQNLITTDIITVVDQNGNQHTYQPQLRPSMFNPMAKELIPFRIHFKNDKVRFDSNPLDEYIISECSYNVTSIVFQNQGGCSSCDGCTAC